jgi:hypothetical protein
MLISIKCICMPQRVSICKCFLVKWIIYIYLRDSIYIYLRDGTYLKYADAIYIRLFSRHDCNSSDSYFCDLESRQADGLH